MKIDFRNVRTRWINVDKDTNKANLMVEMLDTLGFKNHERFSAVTNVKPHEGVRKGEEHYRNCAESHFKILSETIIKDGEPVLILEDDVEYTEAITDFISPDKSNSPIEFPDDVDAIYLGTSHGDGKYDAEKQHDGWLLIQRVFATHAILYLSKEYAEQTIDIGKHWIYERDTPFDVGLAYQLQPTKKVYAPVTPYFYQADSRNTVNKWEAITKTPLKIRDKFRLGTMK